MLKVKVIWGTHRDETFGEKPAKFTASLAEKQPEWEVEFLDLRTLAIPYEIGSPTPSQAKEQYADPAVSTWSQKVKEADAFIIVTTEYNHGYPAILKNALDHLYSEWHRKPVMFVGYGAEMGGARAVEQLRQVAVELHMASIRDAVYIPWVWQAFNEDGTPVNEELAGKFENAFQDLTWWGNALKQARTA
ncbi:MAG: NAD(P)H-dependent oxidoreductase [Candidatus Moraniibacteriota bacterium]